MIGAGIAPWNTGTPPVLKLELVVGQVFRLADSLPNPIVNQHLTGSLSGLDFSISCNVALGEPNSFPVSKLILSWGESRPCTRFLGRAPQLAN